MFKLTKEKNYSYPFLLILAMLIFGPSAGNAQISEYRQLALHHNRPGTYVTVFALPGQKQQEVQFTAAFRINYRLLTFKKLDEAGDSAFYATPSLTIKIYKSPRKNLRFKEQVSVVDLQAVARESWSDTVFATNYEATTKPSNFASGFVQTSLQPGYYTYLLQIGESGLNRRTSATRNIYVNSYTKNENGEIILAGAVDKSGPAARLNLLNMANEVRFSENFYAFVHLPDFSANNSYRLKIFKVNISGNDTVQVEPVLNKAISSGQIMTNINPDLVTENNQLFIKLGEKDEGYAFALVPVPNSRFAEGEYKMVVTEAKSGETVAQKVYSSVWVDKPISLYSVDVAIEMLRFIVDEQTIERIGAGSIAEQREKLNEFWAKRDPTPRTDFNELKAEYYGRIDYVYQHFSSRGTPGFATDQGRIYILYGPPDSIDRVYPTEGPTKEIWTYENRRFVFKATSGFGDYILIETN